MRHTDDVSYAGHRRRAFSRSSSTAPPPYAPSNTLPQTFRALPPQPSPFRTPPQFVPQLMVSSPPAFEYHPTPFRAFQTFNPRITSIQPLSTSIPLLRTSPAPFGSFQYPPARLSAVPGFEYCADPATPFHASKWMKCDVTPHISSPSSAFPDPAATDPLLSGGVRPGGHQLRCFSGTAGYNCNMPSVKLKQNEKPEQKKKKKKLKGKLLKQEKLVQEADKVNQSEQEKSEARAEKVQTVSTPDGSKEKKSDLAPENITQDEMYQNGSKQMKLQASPVNLMQEESKPEGSEERESLAEILMLQVPKRKEPKQKKLKPKKVKTESYYCKSMVVDPWQHLKPVVGNILEPLAGRMSWLPESLTADKEKAPPGSNFQFNFNSTESSLFDMFDTCVQEVLES